MRIAVAVGNRLQGHSVGAKHAICFHAARRPAPRSFPLPRRSAAAAGPETPGHHPDGKAVHEFVALRLPILPGKEFLRPSIAAGWHPSSFVLAFRALAQLGLPNRPSWVRDRTSAASSNEVRSINGTIRVVAGKNFSPALPHGSTARASISRATAMQPLKVALFCTMSLALASL